MHEKNPVLYLKLCCLWNKNVCSQMAQIDEKMTFNSWHALWNLWCTRHLAALKSRWAWAVDYHLIIISNWNDLFYILRLKCFNCTWGKKGYLWQCFWQLSCTPVLESHWASRPCQRRKLCPGNLIPEITSHWTTSKAQAQTNTHSNGSTLFIWKLYNELGSCFFLRVVERAESANHPDVVLGG